MVIHHSSGMYLAPSATIWPKAGVGGCSPKPTKLREAPTKVTQPTSRAIFVKTGDRQLGKISRKRMWNLLVPVNSAAMTKYSLRKLSLIHISEPTRLGMISYAVFCLKKKK